jgi:hypothetical protein
VGLQVSLGQERPPATVEALLGGTVQTDEDRAYVTLLDIHHLAGTPATHTA